MRPSTAPTSPAGSAEPSPRHEPADAVTATRVASHALSSYSGSDSEYTASPARGSAVASPSASPHSRPLASASASPAPSASAKLATLAALGLVPGPLPARKGAPGAGGAAPASGAEAAAPLANGGWPAPAAGNAPPAERAPAAACCTEREGDAAQNMGVRDTLLEQGHAPKVRLARASIYPLFRIFQAQQPRLRMRARGRAANARVSCFGVGVCPGPAVEADAIACPGHACGPAVQWGCPGFCPRQSAADLRQPLQEGASGGGDPAAAGPAAAAPAPERPGTGGGAAQGGSDVASGDPEATGRGGAGAGAPGPAGPGAAAEAGAAPGAVGGGGHTRSPFAAAAASESSGNAGSTLSGATESGASGADSAESPDEPARVHGGQRVPSSPFLAGQAHGPP